MPIAIGRHVDAAARPRRVATPAYGNMAVMAILELVDHQPDWLAALAVALARPPGVPERRSGEDPWRPSPQGRPRRASDDLAWFRDAMDEPDSNGLRPLSDTAAVAAWEAEGEDGVVRQRLGRLRDRGVLQAAGFLLHEPDQVQA